MMQIRTLASLLVTTLMCLQFALLAAWITVDDGSINVWFATLTAVLLLAAAAAGSAFLGELDDLRRNPSRTT